MKRVLAIAILAAACTGQVSPSAAGSPDPSAISGLPTSRATANPCTVAVTQLGAFTQQMADDLAAVRPLVVKKAFDSAATLAATRRVSSILTVYPNLEAVLGNCEATGPLAARLERLATSAEASLGKALAASITDAQIQRGAAAALFGLLPEVLALSQANKEIADSLGMTDQVAEIPDGGAQPLGSLPSLTTPKPSAAPTARPVSAPATGAGPPKTGTGWNAAARITAAAFKADVNSTYVGAMQKANYDIQVAGFQAPGSTPEEREARIEYARILAAVDIINAVGDHYRFMNSNKPAPCFQDAYLADLHVGDAFIATATRIYNDPAGNNDLKSAFDKRDVFLGRLSGYFSDCR